MPPRGALQTPGPAQRLQGLQRAEPRWRPMPQPRGLVLGADSRAPLSDLRFSPPLCLASAPTPGSPFLSEAFSCHQHPACRDVGFCCFKKVSFWQGGVEGCLLGLHSPTVGCRWGGRADLGLAVPTPTLLSLRILCQGRGLHKHLPCARLRAGSAAPTARV